MSPESSLASVKLSKGTYAPGNARRFLLEEGQSRLSLARSQEPPTQPIQQADRQRTRNFGLEELPKFDDGGLRATGDDGAPHEKRERRPAGSRFVRKRSLVSGRQHERIVERPATGQRVRDSREGTRPEVVGIDCVVPTSKRLVTLEQAVDPAFVVGSDQYVGKRSRVEPARVTRVARHFQRTVGAAQPGQVRLVDVLHHRHHPPGDPLLALFIGSVVPLITRLIEVADMTVQTASALESRQPEPAEVVEHPPR